MSVVCCALFVLVLEYLVVQPRMDTPTEKSTSSDYPNPTLPRLLLLHRSVRCVGNDFTVVRLHGPRHPTSCNPQLYTSLSPTFESSRMQILQCTSAKAPVTWVTCCLQISLRSCLMPHTTYLQLYYDTENMYRTIANALNSYQSLSLYL